MTYVLVGENTYEEEIKKSRFIALASPVDTVEKAMAVIETRAIPDARHNWWAYKFGDNDRFSDDGEPGGTAGRPIIQAIEGQECDFVAVLVIRWFGGIKLGTGGLVRAYGGAAAACLRTACKKKYVPTVPIECFCPYAEIDRFKARFDDFQVRIEDEEYGAEGVLWKLQLPEEQIQQFEESLQNMSSGQGWLKS